NFSIQIHGEDPPTLPPSKERAKMDDFYAARSRIIPPLPWSTFSPPFSILFSGSIPFRTAAFHAGEFPMSSSYPVHLKK
ncbi:hypothetical protein, partial [Sedimentitalea sp.]|uniref:hypothetical protein n=1 Tax=Sedimentitalea sp. TaxID=2048915 RepID=UPI003296B79F